ncbi:hypothetical protein Shyhy02_17610 [Streptomyces hygroscopicus subsp. hygroscopicus]|nr:hypothetical protein Shyhy02_17610 [Streptomyces hygroscopicus subsp. hygroscopicus]
MAGPLRPRDAPAKGGPRDEAPGEGQPARNRRYAPTPLSPYAAAPLGPHRYSGRRIARCGMPLPSSNSAPYAS